MMNFVMESGISDLSQETVKIRLFGLLPLLTIKRSRNRELWLLFGFVRLFDVGRKRVRKSPG